MRNPAQLGCLTLYKQHLRFIVLGFLPISEIIVKSEVFVKDGPYFYLGSWAQYHINISEAFEHVTFCYWSALFQMRYLILPIIQPRLI